MSYPHTAAEAIDPRVIDHPSPNSRLGLCTPPAKPEPKKRGRPKKIVDAEPQVKRPPGTSEEESPSLTSIVLQIRNPLINEL